MGQRASPSFAGEQRAILARMVLALAATAAIWLAAWSAAPDAEVQRGRLLAAALLAPAASLSIGIGFVARHRFFHPAAVHGLDPPDDRSLHRAQAYLRNTTEQAVLVGLAYPAMAVALPPALILALPFSAVAFLIGRVGFAAGMGNAPHRRALGFALTFYPTVAGILVSALLLIGTGR